MTNCFRRSISVVIPAYNEEKRLPATLEKVLVYLRRTSWEFAEVLVVDDGSSDKTIAVAEACATADWPVIRVVSNPGNRGKGYSVRHGVLEAKGDWIIFTDADLSAPIEELETLWKAACEQQARVAFGSRAVDRTLIGVRQPVLRELMGRVFNLATRFITGLTFHDTQCGFKLFESVAANDIFGRQLLDGFGFDVEVLFLARKLKHRTIEVPVRWNDVLGTKVNLWNGISAFMDPLRVRWYDMNGYYRQNIERRRAGKPHLVERQVSRD